ncbi:Uncharacterized protein HZ326_1609 [Fusarium oxysporum f. sp. albedinis]|nr:Uncharacterized protein HZ326_1609 [Fusarium oxysporum f. sp. albedinis]
MQFADHRSQPKLLTLTITYAYPHLVPGAVITPSGPNDPAPFARLSAVRNLCHKWRCLGVVFTCLNRQNPSCKTNVKTKGRKT